MNNNQLMYFNSSVEVYWHGALMAAAVLLGSVIFWIAAARIKKGASATVKYVLLFGFPLAIVLSRLEYCWFRQDEFSGIDEMLDIRLGGFGMFGALIAFAVVILLVGLRSRRFTVAELADAAALGLAPALCLGRIASHFSGEERGFELYTELFRRIMFTTYTAADDKTYINVWPYEAIAAAVIFVVAIGCFDGVYRRKRYRQGTVVLRFLLGFAATQTLFESWRSDSLYLVSFGFLRFNQALSAAILVAVIATFCVKYVKRFGYTLNQILVWFVLLVSLALAFASEFTMTGGTHLRNYSGIILGLLGMYIFGRRLVMKTMATRKLSKRAES